jgi:hypothetical protein
MPRFVKALILLLLISCQSEQEKLIGHWHEYKINNPENILNCYRISDSLFTVNSMSYNELDGYRRGIDIKKTEIASWAIGYWNTTSKYLINEDKLIFTDTIHWKKETDKKQFFLEEFSVGLLVNINPPESSNLKFDYYPNEELMTSYLYIGKVKSYLLNDYDLFNKDQYYIQLNDKIGFTDDIASFLICYHCDMNEQIVFIHADKNTPKSFFIEIENELTKIGIPKNQVYYLNIKTEDFGIGYNYRTVTNNVYN